MSLLYDSVKINILEIELCIPILLQFRKTVKKQLQTIVILTGGLCKQNSVHFS